MCSAAPSGSTISCTLSSTSWSSNWSGLPLISVWYPSSRKWAAVTSSSLGRTAVTGRSVMSYRTVPSLNDETPCFARRIPFSSGSGVLFDEVSPLTPFKISNDDSRSSTRSSASRYLWWRSISCHSALVTSRSHRSQCTRPDSSGESTDSHSRHTNCGSVWRPHSAHCSSNPTVSQYGHRRFPNWTEIWPRSVLSPKLCAASLRLRWFPPASPIGKSVCTAGERSRSSDFSGRPIRLPIRVGARSRTWNGATSFTAAIALFPSSCFRACFERSVSDHMRSPIPVSLSDSILIPSESASARHAGMWIESLSWWCSMSNRSIVSRIAGVVSIVSVSSVFVLALSDVLPLALFVSLTSFMVISPAATASARWSNSVTEISCQR